MDFLGKQAGRMIGQKIRDLTHEVTRPAHQHQPPQPAPPQTNQTSRPPPPPPKPASLTAPGISVSVGLNSNDLAQVSLSTGETISALKCPDLSNNTIPNFSRVGYREGHVRIPFVPVALVLSPSPNPCDDDTARIQDAIDQVAKMPLQHVGQDGAQIRGAVLLRAGVYRVAGAIIINASGVVLRGEGQDDQGTTIIATGALQRDFVLVNGMLTSDMGNLANQTAKARTREMMPTNGYKGSKKPVTYTRNEFVPAGTDQLPVLDVQGYNVGDRIVVERPGSDEWISYIGMDKLPPRPDTGAPSTQWTPKTYTFRFERRILAIDRQTNTFTLDIPMVMCLEPQYPPARIYELIHKFNYIYDVGVENLRLVSEYQQGNQEDEKHGWYALVMDNTENGWVADVTTMQFVSGIFAAVWSRYVTIQDCSVLHPISKPSEGGRRYMFNLSGQMGLVKRCYTHYARHDFITLGRVPGPNVFVDSVGEHANNDTGPHERWAMGILYDNITCNTINIRQRSWMGSGQGWAGVFHVVYNCKVLSNSSTFQDPPGASNWIIGLQGQLTNRPMFEAPCTKCLSPQAPVQPRSLYWAQLVERMNGDIQGVKANVGIEAKMNYGPKIC